MNPSHGIERLRAWLGRILLRNETRRIIEHYRQAAVQDRRAGKDAQAERCDYIVIGAIYVGERWPHARR